MVNPCPQQVEPQFPAGWTPGRHRGEEISPQGAPGTLVLRTWVAFLGSLMVPLSDEIHGDIPMKNGGIHLLTYLGRGLWGSFPLGMNQRFWGLGWLMDFEDLDGTNGDFYGTSWGSNMARLLGHLISKFSKITTW